MRSPWPRAATRRKMRAPWLSFAKRLAVAVKRCVSRCGNFRHRGGSYSTIAKRETLPGVASRSRRIPFFPPSERNSVPLLYICYCACHADSKIISFVPADLEDPIAAATACDSCRDAHCLALLPTRLANDPEPERREKFEWVDPPPSDSGEGPE